MDFRPATDAEIIADNAFRIERKWKVSFRHYGVEVYSSRAKLGASIRNKGRSAIRVIDGVPYVLHHGKIERITGTVFDGTNGQPIVINLRLVGVPDIY